MRNQISRVYFLGAVSTQLEGSVGEVIFRGDVDGGVLGTAHAVHRVAARFKDVVVDGVGASEVSDATDGGGFLGGDEFNATEELRGFVGGETCHAHFQGVTRSTGWNGGYIGGGGWVGSCHVDVPLQTVERVTEDVGGRGAQGGEEGVQDLAFVLESVLLEKELGLEKRNE